MCPEENCTELGQMPILSVYSHFAGFKLSFDGYRVDESITTAISQYPTPNTKTDLHRLLKQLSSSTDTVAALLAPL